MKQTIRLLKGSLTQIYRDQMLLLLCFTPFMVSILLKIAIPVINGLLTKYLNFQLTPYYLMVDALVITLNPMLISVMTGLLMLDERDDGICQYYSVTPVGGKAYLMMRLSLPFFYSLIASLVLIPFTSLSGLSYGLMILPAAVSSYGGILMGMILVSIASNKVEGLAVSKLMGIIIFGIPLAWFANSYLRAIGILLPTYWLMDMLLQAKARQFVRYMADFILGVTCTTIWIIGLYRIFIKKIK